MTKRPERLEKKLKGSTRREGWGPTRTGIKKRNQSSILEVRIHPPSDPQVGCLIVRCCDTGEEIKEPEVDLSNFLARQRLDDVASSSVLGLTTEPGEDEVDYSLAHLKSGGPQSQSARKLMKGRVEMVEWDEELENMSREKAAADANRGESE